MREHLSGKFHIAVRVREIGEAKGFRIYQTRKEGDRHLVDLRTVDELPNAETIENVLVLSPVELIVSKVVSLQSRKSKPKAGTDWRDLAMLLLRFPELKEKVSESLQAKNVGEAVLKTWVEIERQDFQFEDDDEDLIF